MCPRPLSRTASTCVNNLPCGDNSTTSEGLPRRSRMASTAFASGSGFITIPGPPPYGMSSIER